MDRKTRIPSVRVTFNDGGWGFMSNHLKFQMPVTREKRIALHRHFGEGGEKAIRDAIGHHLINCLKNTGPLMSGSEHQSQRKAEFYQVVSEQLSKGLYSMERVKQKLERSDKTEGFGDEQDVQYITRIKREADGQPVISAPSPLTEYGITVVQYNQTDTIYDPDTVTQINAKRNSYQLAEEAKAGVEKEHQKLQEVIEKGRLAVASVEAEQQKIKKGILVNAQKDLDVKGINQQEQVTIAEQAVAVAGRELETSHDGHLETSKIAIKIAEAESRALISLSEATRAKLDQGGALSERDKMLAEMRMQRNTAIAKSIAEIPSPRTVILSDKSSHGGAANSTTDTLMNLIMLGSSCTRMNRSQRNRHRNSEDTSMRCDGELNDSRAGKCHAKKLNETKYCRCRIWRNASVCAVFDVLREEPGRSLAGPSISKRALRRNPKSTRLVPHVLLARVTTYPRMISVYGTKDSRPESPGDDSVKAWFNDGGTADISWVVRVTTPCPTEEDENDPASAGTTRPEATLNSIANFTGNVANATNAVRSAVRNVIQQTGPIMSSTENQSARKGEFWHEVYAQLRDGMFAMKPVVIKANTSVSTMLQAMKKENDHPSNVDAVKPILAAKKDTIRAAAGSILEERSITASETVMAAEIVRDPATGKPLISSPSALDQYGMRVLQFSILETDYDAETVTKFGAKKQLYLQAEQSKAATIQSIQERFKRVAQGEREIAEEQWTAEKDRAEKRIQAETTQEKEQTIKETLRVEAETKALIAEVKKKLQVTMEKIADIKAQIAENDKQAAEIAAKARDQQIEIAGAISDRDKGLGAIQVQEIKAVTAALRNLKVPDTVILSPDALQPNGGTAMEQALPSLQLLKSFDLLKGENEFRMPPRIIAPKKEMAKTESARVDEVK